MNCPKCGNPLREGAKFCGICGNKVEEAPQPNEEPVSEVKSTSFIPDEVQPSATAAAQAAEEVENTAEAAENTAEAAADGALEAVENAVEEAVDKAAEAVDNTAEAAAEQAAGAVDAAESKAEAAADGALEAVENAVEEAVDKAAGAVDNAAEAAAEQAAGAVDAAESKAEDAVEAVENAANKAVNAAKNGFDNVAAAVKTDVQGAAAAVKGGNFKDLLKNKTFLVCCGLIIAVILIILISTIAFVAVKMASVPKIKGSYYFVDDGRDGFCFYNGKMVEGVDLSDSADLIGTSLDGTAAVVEDGEDLYYFKDGKAKLITDDFDTSRASISANGKAVAYVSDDKVFVFNGSKPVEIAELENDYMCNPVISPNGKVVAFSDIDDDDIITYAWKGGKKAIDLETDIVPVSVSDGGKIIYGGDSSGNLYYIRNLKPDSDEKIGEINGIRGISLDHTKLLYSDEDGDTCCFDTSISKEDGVRVTKGSVSVYSDFLYMGYCAYITDFKSFLGRESNGSLYRYFRKGKDYDDEKLISGFSGIRISDDGKSFVYLDDYDVVKGTFSNAKNAKKIIKDVDSIRVSGDLKHIFYLDDDGDLRYGTKDGRIASDIDDYVVTDSGVCVFSDDDGDLYYSVKGGGKKSAGISDVDSVEILNNVVFVEADDELYISTNGKSFKKTGVDLG